MRHCDNELMPDGLTLRPRYRQPFSQRRERGEITVSNALASAIPFIKMTEFDAQYRGLKTIQAAVNAFAGMDVLRMAAVIGQHASSVDQGPVIAHYGAAVAERS